MNYKKRQYESVANVEMKNGKMKFILAFFILPDDKKRPYILSIKWKIDRGSFVRSFVVVVVFYVPTLL